MTDTVQRYLDAMEKLMSTNQPTIAQHQEFINEMRVCAADNTEDRESYLRMAEAHERIIAQKKWQANIDELGNLSKR